MVTWKVYHPDYPNSLIAHGYCMNLDPMLKTAEEIAMQAIKGHFRRNHSCDKLKLIFRVDFPNGEFAEWWKIVQ